MTNITETIITGVTLNENDVTTLTEARKLIKNIGDAIYTLDAGSDDWVACKTAQEIIDDILIDNLAHLSVFLEI